MYVVMPRMKNWLLVLLALSLFGCGDDAERAARPADSTAPPTGAAPGKGADVQTPSKPAVTTQKAPAPAAAAKMAPTPATVVRATELKEKPSVEAKTIKPLPVKTAVTIVDRDGGWYRVAADGEQGWVRLLHVSSQPSGAGGSTREELESAAKIATGRAGTGNIVNTTGIRGLSEEQLRSAEPNPAELQRLENYGVGKEQATAYARAHGLERRQVAHLPEPR